MSKGVNGVGGLVEVFWVLYVDEKMKGCLVDVVKMLGECWG